MDVKMPRVDGIQAARTISDEAIAPVVMLTAFSQAGLVDEAAQAGAMGYVVKPFSRDDLRPAMQVAVSRYSEMRLLTQQVGDLERAPRDAQAARPRQGHPHEGRRQRA